MDLIEILTLIIGPSIAKIILKFWFKDSEILNSTTETVLEIIKIKTSDVLAQQKAKRQFESIGEEIALSLMPIFENEGQKINSDQKTFIANEVGIALENLNISSELLVEINLDPKLLSQYLLEANHKISNQISEQEHELYKRIIYDVSQYIIDISSQFPSFTERSIAEILKREYQLLFIVREILEEVKRIRLQSSERNLNIAEASFEVEYRRAVIRKLDQLELFGVDVSNSSKRHQLTVAYVSLNVTKNVTGKTATVELPVEQALSNSNRFIIRGVAGSGKTTLLQWLAVKSASENFEDPLKGWNKCIPFFIQLRKFSESEFPRPEEFPSLIAPSISGVMPQGWVHRKLRDGFSLVLIDGIDELPFERREDVKKWIAELTTTYEKSAFIITSRPSALKPGWFSQHKFIDAELQPMQRKEIIRFIDHWHKAIDLENIHLKSEKNFEELADHLKAIIRTNKPIAYLATSPLLCAMLCALHRDRHKNIPADRIDLYNACISMLLERRDLERGISLKDYPILTYRQKFFLLQELAFYMLINGWSSIQYDRLLSFFNKKLATMQNLPEDILAEKIISFFIERSGLLKEASLNFIDFTHRTFFEFFAANASLEGDHGGLLVQNGSNDQWKEVIILAAGLGNKNFRERLIEGLIIEGQSNYELRPYYHFLAVACLETTIDISKSLVEQIEFSISLLVPPKNFEEAKAMASAGELALPFIKPYFESNVEYESDVIAFCIRTLALIGTESALNILATYNKKTNDPLLMELLRAWDFFDRHDYAKRVLTKITTLYLAEILSLDRVRNLRNLEFLSAQNCRYVETLQPISRLKKLKAISLHDCESIKDFSPLLSCDELLSLHLFFCKATTINDICEMTHLSELSLVSFNKVSTIRPLSKLNKLVYLNLAFTNLLYDLKILSNMKYLETLDLRGCNNLRDISTIEKLQEITYLDIRECNSITKYNYLYSLSKLKKLGITEKQRKNLDQNFLSNIELIS